PKDIKRAMKEIYRSSNKYIWGFEYYSKKYEEIIYRGKKNLLWKANFQKLYLELFNDLRLIKQKRLKYLNNKNIDMMFLLKKVNKR
ncbi:MAG: methyltransferase type 11, partial [Candidatus Omnitrophota bacterium]